jgi:hypothetical protein
MTYITVKMTGCGANILCSGDQTYMLLPGQNWEFVNRVWSLWQSMTLNCWFRSTIGIAQESSHCGTCLVPNFSDSNYSKEERCPQISEDIILTLKYAPLCLGVYQVEYVLVTRNLRVKKAHNNQGLCCVIIKSI